MRSTSELEINERPGREPDPDRGGPPTFMPSWKSSKLTALTSAPAPKASTSPISRDGQAEKHPEHERRGGDYTPAEGGVHGARLFPRCRVVPGPLGFFARGCLSLPRAPPVLDEHARRATSA
jgi:hypothetical protein